MDGGVQKSYTIEITISNVCLIASININTLGDLNTVTPDKPNFVSRTLQKRYVR